MTILSEDEFKRCINNMCAHIAKSQPVLMPPLLRGLETENAALRVAMSESEQMLSNQQFAEDLFIMGLAIIGGDGAVIPVESVFADQIPTATAPTAPDPTAASPLPVSDSPSVTPASGRQQTDTRQP